MNLVTPESEAAGGLSRDTVVHAALDLLDEAGVDALSMRALAERLGVKAASLYWHLRDKEQLLEMLSEAILDEVELPIIPSGWRAQTEAACAQLGARLNAKPARAAVVVSCLPAVQRTRLARDIARTLAAEGLGSAGPASFSLLLEVAASVTAERPAAAGGAEELTLAIDSGSWRVAVRAGALGDVDVARSVGGGGAPLVDIRPDRLVVVRNRHGGYRGAAELSPAHTWHVKVHGGTWNTSLDLSGLRISGIELDSGAGNVTCVLPHPVGAVPIRVNSGIIGVTLRRPPGTALRATVSSGSARVRFDGKSIKGVTSDVHWSSSGAAQAPDRYEVTVYSGCVKVTVDQSAPPRPVPPAKPPPASGAPGVATADAPTATGVSLLLDGIEAQLAAQRG